MLHPRLAAFTLAILTASIGAFPASFSSYFDPRTTIEIWRIPRMELHMMTRHSGLPGGGGWPENSKYPSTIDFDVNMPNYQNVHCHNEFENGTLPHDLATCTGQGVRARFRMSEYTALGPRRKELSFVLEVSRVEMVTGQQTVSLGKVAITVNNPTEPTSYLTCLLGPPFGGLRCKLHGPMSNHKELEVVAHISTSLNTSNSLAVS